MKRVVLFLLALVCVVTCAVACGETVTTTDGTTTPDTNTSGGLTTSTTTSTSSGNSNGGAPVEKFESLKIAGQELSQYKIVYAQSDLADEAAANPKYYPVWDFNKETAEHLSDLIFEVTGVRLSVACDVETSVSDKEILIGKTNREETTSLLLAKVPEEEYKVCVSGTKLVICGGRYGSTWHALDYIEALFTGELAKNNANYNFAADTSYTGTFDFVRIGCIGDSITQGSKVSIPNRYAYSAQLERWLWKDAIVTNLGNSGKTLRDDLSDSYMKTNSYQKALILSEDIDIFTIMLGTNDGNRVGTGWNDSDSAAYKRDYEKLVTNLSKKNPDIQFVIMNCPTTFRDASQNYDSDTIRALQRELVDELAAKGFKTAFFDMQAVTKNLSAHYPDQLHPDQNGHTIMAEALQKTLAELIKGIR